MDLDELNRQVTSAITRAAGLPRGSLEASAALHDVSRLEEAIARVTRPDDVEGEAARIGAVSAALDAGEALRAMLLAECFLQEGPGAETRRQLEQLLTEANEAVTTPGATVLTVQPVTFELPAAAGWK